MKILSEVIPNDFGLIYWYEKTSYEVPQEQIDKMRQKSMSDMLYGALQTAMYNNANQNMDVQTAMQRGWNEANKQVNQIQNGTEMKSEMFLIGDPNTLSRFVEIETSPNFRGWCNNYIVDQIRQFYENI